MPTRLIRKLLRLLRGLRRVAHQPHKLADLQAQRFLHHRVRTLRRNEIVAQERILLPHAVRAVLRL